MTTLTPQAVQDLLEQCLPYEKTEMTDEQILELVDAGYLIKTPGIMATFVFDPKKIEEHKAEICDLASQLHDEFFMDTGGGWSFLNICSDKDDNLWTGEHRVCEMLCVLMIAAGIANWVGPKEIWEVMPGGMPYIQIIPKAQFPEAVGS